MVIFSPPFLIISCLLMKVCEGVVGMLLGVPFVDTTDANLSVLYSGEVSSTKLSMYRYHYKEVPHKTTAVRISTESESSDTSFPTIFVVRQERSVLSWQIPLLMHYTYEYHAVSRTLCPLDSNIPSLQMDQTFYVDISTLSNTSIPYKLKAEILTDFEIKTHEYKKVTSSPSKPVYYLYTFPGGIDNVVVTAKSDDTKCMTLSIQAVKCPVFDLDKDVEYQGAYQTMTKQGAITVNRNTFSDSFYIILVVKPNDLECSSLQSVVIAGDKSRLKNITLYVKEMVPTFQYYKATLAAVGFFLIFYVVALIIGCFYHGCKKDWGIINFSEFDQSTESGLGDSTRVKTPLSSQAESVRTYGAVPQAAASEMVQEMQQNTGRPRFDNSTDESEDSIKEYDLLPDADKDKNIFRTKTHLYVCDLARKSEKRQAKRYRLYTTNLITISVFYGLPVLQLVFTYQKVLNATGDQDICYYNFACAHPLGRVSSFNNIFSNCGYVMLGVLFLILVARRHFLYGKAVQKSAGRDKFRLNTYWLLPFACCLGCIGKSSSLFGIPQHYGLFYAMGFALCMEGFMSGCYHVCPTVSNFQFDTSFMYIIACLCILKIYQNRHPDISANSHSSYLVMALIIIVAVLGVLYGTNVFWILFALVYMFVSMVLSIHLYYMGRWQLDRYIFKRVFLLVRTDWLRCSKPTYCNRFVLLLVGNIVNWGMAIVAMTTPFADFASFLLSIFIINLLLYNIFYIVSKCLMKEKIARLTIMFILLSMLTWGFALYFFLAHLTSWQLTPAKSREGNKDCILMNFYDAHDVWHFLSAISLFFSFLVLLTLDDEIIFTRRDKIPVF